MLEVTRQEEQREAKFDNLDCVVKGYIGSLYLWLTPKIYTKV